MHRGDSKIKIPPESFQDNLSGSETGDIFVERRHFAENFIMIPTRFLMFE